MVDFFNLFCYTITYIIYSNFILVQEIFNQIFIGKEADYMNNFDNKGTKIQHHQYNNGSRRGKRKLHKGRVAGAILSLVLVVGLGFGGYKLVDKFLTLGDSESIPTNNGNVVDNSNINDTSTTTSVVTVSPSVETMMTTTTVTTTSITNTSDVTSNSSLNSNSSSNSNTSTERNSASTTLATIIDDNGNIVIPDSTKGYDNRYTPVDDDINYSNNGDDNSNIANGSQQNNNGNNQQGNDKNNQNGTSNTGDNSNSNNNNNNNTTGNNSNNSNTGNNNNGQNTSSNSNSYYLSEDDISSEETLKNVLSKVDTSSYGVVVLPLKVQGGTLNYNSKINSAINSGVVGSYVDLEDMVKLIKDAGFTPYASISVLYDNIYPKTYKKTAYQFEDGSGSWWDDAGENGGKPWLSPFSQDTKNYLSAISAELTEDGIQGIICEDVIFPNFREKDLGYIGDIVKSENRYTALVDVLNTIQKSANEKDVLFKFPLVDALRGKVEALKPSELNSNIILTPSIKLSDLSSTFSYDGNSISLSSQSTYNKVKLSMELFQKMSGNLNIVPSIDVSNLTASQKKDVISALQDMGYTNYLLQ